MDEHIQKQGIRQSADTLTRYFILLEWVLEPASHSGQITGGCMISGFIDQYGYPLVELEVRGLKKEEKTLALIDSGFDGELCLPIEVAISLGLELCGMETMELADGSVRKELVFTGTIKWEGKLRDVKVWLTSADQALIGTDLMLDRLLTIDFRTGEVKIEK